MLLYRSPITLLIYIKLSLWKLLSFRMSTTSSVMVPDSHRSVIKSCPGWVLGCLGALMLEYWVLGCLDAGVLECLDDGVLWC